MTWKFKMKHYSNQNTVEEKNDSDVGKVSIDDTSSKVLSTFPSCFSATSATQAGWTKKCPKFIQRCWESLQIVSIDVTTVVALVLFLFAAMMTGQCTHILFDLVQTSYENYLETKKIENDIDALQRVTEGSTKFNLKEVGLFWVVVNAFSHMAYFCMGGFLHWYYYTRRRNFSEDWKCQPREWMSAELRWQEVMLGTFSLTVANTISAFLAWHVWKGGWTTIYFNASEYGWWWYFASIPIVFVHQDFSTYWTHRLYHTSFLYKTFHKVHHRYRQPTPFSVTAVHPVELVHMQAVIISPMFMYPVHWSVLVGLILYAYYHGILAHSGIDFKSYWWQPWQPASRFHDNHHQYFNVNFGFNCVLWDKIFGTERREDRICKECHLRNHAE